MNPGIYPPEPVFVASVQEFLHGPADWIHQCMGTIVTGLHVLTICSCLTTFDPHDRVFLLKMPGKFRVVAGTKYLHHHGSQRGATNFFTHRNCGGIPRIVDLALVKIDRPWKPFQEFGVAPLGIDPDKSYNDYVIKTKHTSVDDCYVFTWVNRGSIEEESKPHHEKTLLELKQTYQKAIEECYPFNMTVEGKNVTIEKPSSRDDKFCAMMSIGRGCGVDKGAPLICRKTNANDREIFLMGVGLGGTKCIPGVASFSLYQGFKDSLTFLRLYLAIDDTLLPEKKSVGAAFAFEDEPFA